VSSQKLVWKIQVYKDKNNHRSLIYEKTCSSVYELHIGIEEAVSMDYTIIVITKRDW